MINFFSVETLAEVFKRCSEYPDYIAGIIFNDVALKIDFLHNTLLSIRRRELPEVYKMQGDSLGSTIIYFLNGSRIEAYLNGTNLRGKRFHHILVESISSDSILNDIVIPYSHSESNEVVDDSSEALDKFLSKFTVH